MAKREFIKQIPEISKRVPKGEEAALREECKQHPGQWTVWRENKDYDGAAANITRYPGFQGAVRANERKQGEPQTWTWFIRYIGPNGEYK